MKAYNILSFLFVSIFVLLLGCDHTKNIEKKYQHRIGYIDPQTSEYSEDFQLCDEKYILGYYSSYAPKIYKNDKFAFRKYIRENYQNRNYKDSGFLNLRFHINCKGQIGNLEVNELDENLVTSSFNNELCQQLIDLSIDENNWNPAEHKGKRYDIYMYLIFKIENGNVLEILP